MRWQGREQSSNIEDRRGSGGGGGGGMGIIGVIVVTHSKEVAQASDITLELKDKKLTETRNTTK